MNRGRCGGRACRSRRGALQHGFFLFLAVVALHSSGARTGTLLLRCMGRNRARLRLLVRRRCGLRRTQRRSSRWADNTAAASCSPIATGSRCERTRRRAVNASVVEAVPHPGGICRASRVFSSRSNAAAIRRSEPRGNPFKANSPIRTWIAPTPRAGGCPWTGGRRNCDCHAALRCARPVKAGFKPSLPLLCRSRRAPAWSTRAARRSTDASCARVRWSPPR